VITSLNSINRLIVVMETGCVFFDELWLQRVNTWFHIVLSQPYTHYYFTFSKSGQRNKFNLNCANSKLNYVGYLCVNSLSYTDRKSIVHTGFDSLLDTNK
jgi:hypothetical protein